MYKSKHFIRALFLFIYSAAALSHPLKHHLCRVGEMKCKNYCSGALVVKIYQLIQQGLKPLCDINVTYNNHKHQCQVNILDAEQRFDQKGLTKIALTKNRTDFDKQLNPNLLKATYLCPHYWRSKKPAPSRYTLKRPKPISRM